MRATFFSAKYLGRLPGSRIKSKVQGVSVRKLSQRVRGLGIREGDILISMNGTKVRNRLHAMREAKRQWRQGVRTFEMVFLRRGQETTITYELPNK